MIISVFLTVLLHSTCLDVSLKLDAIKANIPCLWASTPISECSSSFRSTTISFETNDQSNLRRRFNRPMCGRVLCFNVLNSVLRLIWEVSLQRGGKCRFLFYTKVYLESFITDEQSNRLGGLMRFDSNVWISINGHSKTKMDVLPDIFTTTLVSSMDGVDDMWADMLVTSKAGSRARVLHELITYNVRTGD